VPPRPVDLEGNGDEERRRTGEWKVPVVLDFHGGGPWTIFYTQHKEL
jgi:ATP-dependent RNA helicase DDX3X